MSRNINISNLKFSKLLIILLTIFIFSNNILFAKSTFSSERIKSSIEKLIFDKSNGKAIIEFISDPRTCEFFQDDVDAEIFLVNELNPGFNIVALKFSHNNKILKYLEINLRVKLFKKVWVTSRNISANTILNENDFILKEKLINSNLEIADINDMIGKQISRFVAKDEFVSKDMLLGELLIKRNEKVTLIVETGAIRVRCNGTAIQDGSAGQIIRVKRDGSATVLTGKVSSTGEVIIYSNNISLN